MGWALVTGASGDLGAVVARRLAREGFDVVIHTFRRIKAAQDLAVEIESLGQRAIVFKAHLGAEAGSAKMAEEIKSSVGSVEIVVSAAASGVMQPLGKLTDHHLRWTMNSTALPVVALAQVLKPRSIVALSSAGASRVVPSYAAVGAAKAALEAFVRYLAVEMAPHTQVNALSVGLVDTRSARLLPQWEEVLVDALEATPAGRLVRPEEVAEAVVWLTSNNSKMITGATIMLDGGRTLLL